MSSIVTLGQIKTGDFFRFGGILFTVIIPSDNELVFCKIAEQPAHVYITDHALVERLEGPIQALYQGRSRLLIVIQEYLRLMHRSKAR